MLIASATDSTRRGKAKEANAPSEGSTRPAFTVTRAARFCVLPRNRGVYSKGIVKRPVEPRLRSSLAVKWVPDQKGQKSNHDFLAGIFTVAALAAVFTLMQLKRKHPRAPRMLVDRRSSALAYNGLVPITAPMTLAPFEETGRPPTLLEIKPFLASLKQPFAAARQTELDNILQMPIGNRLPLAKKHVSTWTGEFEKMAEVLAFKDWLTHADWLQLLGMFWNECDNIRDYRLELRRILGTNGPLRQMMSSEENSHYDSLPDTIACYRGCDASALVGASWTRDKKTAKLFPTYTRYRAPNPVLITARVKRVNVLSVQLRRNEEELITFSARRVSVETGRWTSDGHIVWPTQDAA
jgi:hypothetical protein